MSRERHSAFTRVILSASLVWSHLPTGFTPPFRDYLTLDHKCAEILPHLQKYDAIAVFGAGTYIDSEGVERPNDYQVGRLKAAAAIYAAGYSNTIILIDGGTGEVVQSSTELLSSSVSDFSDGALSITEANVISLGPSFSTADEVHHLKGYMQRNNFKKILAVSDIFHHDRLRLLTKGNEMEIDFAPTECVAQSYYPEDIELLTERNKSAEMQAMLRKETLAIIEIGLIDKTGELSVNLERLAKEGLTPNELFSLKDKTDNK
jgi:hypothetical protein